MTICYIKMKIRAGGGSFRAAGCSPLLFLFMGNTIISDKISLLSILSSKNDAAGNLTSNPYPPVIPGLVAYLIIDCHDPGRTVSWEQNMHSGSFNNAEQFSINVCFNTFYSTAKSR